MEESKRQRQAHNIQACFRKSGWSHEELEPGVWHSAFAGEDGREYHLYVFAAEDWVQFAVSPLLTASPQADAGGGMYAALLRLNQDLRLARLALDADGDINLLAELPADGVTAAPFGQVLEVLAFYTGELGPQLRRFLADPQVPFPAYE
jgi:hypothetical protein